MLHIKYDNCNATDVPMRDAYQAMYDALDTAMSESGRDIVFSLCSWEFNEWNPLMGQLWRTTSDIRAVFNDSTQQVKSYVTYTVLQLASRNKAYAAYAGPNSWNDADMLEVGNLGTSDLANAESQTHFSLWAIMASPLIAGNKLDSMTDTTLDSDQSQSDCRQSRLPGTEITGSLTTMKGNDPPQNVNVDLSGKYRLTLLVTGAGDGSVNDYADWADAKLTCAP